MARWGRPTESCHLAVDIRAAQAPAAGATEPIWKDIIVALASRCGCGCSAGLLDQFAVLLLMEPPQVRFAELLQLLREVHDLEAAAELLEWDQETYMPEQGAEARGRQLATLRKVAHERFTGDRAGHLLDSLSAAFDDPRSFEASLVRASRRDFDRAVRLPAALVAEMARVSARARVAWRAAREQDNFARFAPHLRQIVQLSIRKAEALGYASCRYDALLDEYEPEMTTERVTVVFEALRGELVPFVRELTAADAPRDDFLREVYPTSAQWDFGIDVLRDIGYDFRSGRQDVSAHPFSTSFSIKDVRITTRLNERYLPSALFGSLHEAGHALYEQGIDPALEGTPLASGTSLGMHESQSRLWENQVGRSRAFWRHYYSRLQARFDSQLGHVSREAFYRAINRVSPSLIRVEADEVTYNLHIMLRFELELALIEERITVEELPEAWNAAMVNYLGIRPESNAQGVLQDIHWALGAFGYFPTYALGNLMAAQLYARAKEVMPDLDEAVARGCFSPLLQWLRAHVHTHGRKMTAEEILESATGAGLSARPWLQDAKDKFGALYGIR